MANTAYGGFRLWGSFSGGEGVFPRTLRGELASGYATGVFRGDVLIPVSDGTLAVGAAANNGLLVGVANGFSYVKADGKRYYAPFIPASTTFTPSTVGSVNASYVDYYPLTADLIWEVDATGTAAATYAIAIGYIGENVDIAAGTGDTVTGVSGQTVDIAGHVATTMNFRIVGISGYGTLGQVVPTNLNDLTLTRAKYLVVCNEGFLPPFTTAGV